ncbi:MAG: hypothetical protein M1834_005640 [Cirrosporium novae-zelandiae]|nr:MAG: hypothetical protein M1834_005640 [Cirrosporium novae-zelandiae]
MSEAIRNIETLTSACSVPDPNPLTPSRGIANPNPPNAPSPGTAPGSASGLALNHESIPAPMPQPSPLMLTGHCACGFISINITINPAVSSLYIIHCHCELCRRHSGGAFQYESRLKPISLLIGEVVLKKDFEARRAFCATCGSSLWMKYPKTPAIGVCLGVLDEDSMWAAKQKGMEFLSTHVSWENRVDWWNWNAAE